MIKDCFLSLKASYTGLFGLAKNSLKSLLLLSATVLYKGYPVLSDNKLENSPKKSLLPPYSRFTFHQLISEPVQQQHYLRLAAPFWKYRAEREKKNSAYILEQQQQQPLYEQLLM